jgi:hypothetical protein
MISKLKTLTCRTRVHLAWALCATDDRSKFPLSKVAGDLAHRPQLHRTTVSRAFKTESSQFRSNTLHLPVFRTLLFGGGSVATCAAVEAKAEVMGSVVERVRFLDTFDCF